VCVCVQSNMVASLLAHLYTCQFHNLHVVKNCLKQQMNQL